MTGAPDPFAREPVAGHARVRYLATCVDSPLVEVGAYSYYDDPHDASHFFTKNVLYHYGPERLRIGKFCALATGVRFIMNGANHRRDGVSTFPFPIFGDAWAASADLLRDLPSRGDTVVGNDVWLGYEALVMPGVTIGDGAIVGARAVVTDDVRPYAVALGNPATERRRRFDDATVERLLEIAWWDWPIERITANVRALMAGDVARFCAES